MRNAVQLFVLFLIPLFCIGQDISVPASKDNLLSEREFTINDPLFQYKGYPMEGFAVSFNPLGFLFCGPTINADIRLANRLMFRAHLRLSSYGMMMSTSGPHETFTEVVGNVAVGGGPIYFFGEKLSKPYLGLILDGGRSKCTFYNLQHDKCETIIKTTTFSMNGGYRIRFISGLFVNGGVYIGACYKKWEWYCYKDTSPGHKETHTDDHNTHQTSVFFVGEIAIGFAF